MYPIRIDDVHVGQIIAEPVFSEDGLLVCNPGTPVSEYLKNYLKEFDIELVYVQPIIDEKLDKRLVTFQSLSKMLLLTVHNLTIEEQCRYSYAMVDALIDLSVANKYKDILNYDEHTGKHCKRVALLALLFGLRIGLSGKDLYHLALGGLLHDIGKIKVPLEIITAPRRLTDEEYEIVKEHTNLGVAILLQDNNDIPQAVMDIVLFHHENMDGTGYPKNLRDFHINKLARIIHIIDVYEAMCSKRSYKDAYPRRYVREYMLEHTGQIFDPILLKKFLQLVPTYIIGEELENNGVIGVVTDITDETNPLISINKNVVRLHDFRNVKYSKETVFEEFHDIVFR